MILVFDVGNTETTIGALRRRGAPRALAHDHRRRHGRPTSIGVLLPRSLRSRDGVGSRASIGRRDRLRRARASPVRSPRPAQRWLGAPVHHRRRSALPITLDVEEPLTVGADRIINTLAASRLYARDSDRRRPRHRHDLRLHHRRRRLPGRRDRARRSDVGGDALPAHVEAAGHGARSARAVIGRRTEECIRAGVMFGAAESIDGLVRRIKAEWPTPRDRRW